MRHDIIYNFTINFKKISEEDYGKLYSSFLGCALNLIKSLILPLLAHTVMKLVGPQ